MNPSSKDISIFEVLKTSRSLRKAGNSTWFQEHRLHRRSPLIDNKEHAIVAFEGTQAEMLIENNTTKKNRIEEEQLLLTGADTAQLGTEFTVLLNTYQTLLAAFSKMQSISILNYLS